MTRRPAAASFPGHFLAAVLALGVAACSEEKGPSETNGSVEVLDTYQPGDFNRRDGNHPDARVIRQLLAAGADLNKPHQPDFQFEFGKLEDARAVAGELKSRGFAREIRGPDVDGQLYELIARKEMIIEFESMAGLTDGLRELAVKHRGELIGWGTSVEE